MQYGAVLVGVAIVSISGCGGDAPAGSGGASGTGSGPATTASLSSGGASTTGDGSGGAASSGTAEASTSTGTAMCTPQGVYDDPSLDACAADQCCAEAMECASAPERCFVPGTRALDLDDADARALRDCVRSSGCAPALCDAPIALDDVDLAACLAAECCDELYTCARAHPEDCLACIDAGPPYADACAPVESCAREACDGTLSEGAGGGAPGGAGGHGAGGADAR